MSKAKKTAPKKAMKKAAVPAKKNPTPATTAGSTATAEKVKYDEKIGKKAAATAILGSKTVISVYVKKQDGTHRWMAGRIQATDQAKLNLGQVNFRDMVQKKNITVNLPEVKYLRSGGKCFKVG